MAFAAAWVQVDDVHQLAHAVLAVTHHLRRLAPRRRHQLVAHHQQAKVAARQKLFDHHRAMLGCRLVGDGHVLVAGDIDGHALALIAILRLDRDRHADLLGSGPGVVDVCDRPAQRHRYACSAQQFFGEVLVLRDGFGDGTGGVKFCGLNAPLVRAPAKLHHAALGQTAVRNAARHCRINNRPGAGPEPFVFIERAQLGNRLLQIKRAVANVIEGGLHQRLRQLERQAAHRLFAVLDHDLVSAGLERDLGVAEGDGAACGGLQFKCRRFQHMGQRHRAGVAGLAQRAHGGEERAHA